MTRRVKRNHSSAGEFENGVAESTGGATGRIFEDEGRRISKSVLRVKEEEDVCSDWSYRTYAGIGVTGGSIVDNGNKGISNSDRQWWRHRSRIAGVLMDWRHENLDYKW